MVGSIDSLTGETSMSTIAVSFLLSGLAVIKSSYLKSLSGTFALRSLTIASLIWGALLVALSIGSIYGARGVFDEPRLIPIVGLLLGASVYCLLRSLSGPLLLVVPITIALPRILRPVIQPAFVESPNVDWSSLGEGGLIILALLITTLAIFFFVTPKEAPKGAIAWAVASGLLMSLANAAETRYVLAAKSAFHPGVESMAVGVTLALCILLFHRGDTSDGAGSGFPKLPVRNLLLLALANQILFSVYFRGSLSVLRSHFWSYAARGVVGIIVALVVGKLFLKERLDARTSFGATGLIAALMLVHYGVT
jgi:hypothetical protein